MPEILRPDGTVLQYELVGSGEPVLALAPGGVSSERSQWLRRGVPLTSLGSTFVVVAMDQRHAGGSRANLAPFSYDDALGDQLAVLDHAGVESAHLLGMGIGAAYALKLAYDAPARVRSACLIHPIGVDESNQLDDHYQVFNETIRTARAEGLDGVIAAARDNPCFSDNPAGGPWAQRLHDEPAFRDALRSLGREMYIALVVDFRDGMFPAGRRFFSINDVAVTRIRAPLLIVPGHDRRHPAGIARTISAQVPGAELALADGDNGGGDGLVDRIADFIGGRMP